MGRRVTLARDLRFQLPLGLPGEVEVCPAGFSAETLTPADVRRLGTLEDQQWIRRVEQRMRSGQVSKTDVFFVWQGRVRRVARGDVVAEGPKHLPEQKTSSGSLPSWVA